MKRTIAFWLWFTVAVASLARLWSTIDAGGLFARFGPADAIALVLFVVSGTVLAWAQYRMARGERE